MHLIKYIHYFPAVWTLLVVSEAHWDIPNSGLHKSSCACWRCAQRTEKNNNSYLVAICAVRYLDLCLQKVCRASAKCPPAVNTELTLGSENECGQKYQHLVRSKTNCMLNKTSPWFVTWDLYLGRGAIKCNNHSSGYLKFILFH